MALRRRIGRAATSLPLEDDRSRVVTDRHPHVRGRQEHGQHRRHVAMPRDKALEVAALHQPVAPSRPSAVRARASRSSGSNGLVRYASTPAARPCSRSTAWPLAVSMMTVVWALATSALIAWAASNPFRLGIWTSRKTRSGR